MDQQTIQPIGNGNSATLLTCLGNQRARGRKYDSLTFAPSFRKKAVESGSFGL